MLTLESVSKTFPRADRGAVDDLSLTLEPAEILAVVGESGCGKTTLLRIVAGLETPDSGTVKLGRTTVAGPPLKRPVPPEKRNVGLVFQDHALFPHLNVWENVNFGIRSRKIRDSGPADHALELVGLTDLQKRFPHELSGGQRQRVALARALAPRPDVLLLDEPFSSLDAARREQVRDDVATILRASGTSAILVTHDTGDAFAVADRAALMVNGKIVQTGRPELLYQAPADEAAARLFGPVNVLPDGTLHRPETLALTGTPASGSLPATVLRCTFAGGRYIVLTACKAGGTLRVYSTAPVPPGTEVHLRPL